MVGAIVGTVFATENAKPTEAFVDRYRRIRLSYRSRVSSLDLRARGCQTKLATLRYIFVSEQLSRKGHLGQILHVVAILLRVPLDLRKGYVIGIQGEELEIFV